MQCDSDGGSPAYAAPEVRACAYTGISYDARAADVWSLGICLWLFVTGYWPLREATSKDWRFERLRRSQVVKGASTVHTIHGWYKKAVTLSPELVSLLNSLLQVEPTARPTLAEVLQSPWLREAAASYAPLNEGLLAPTPPTAVGSLPIVSSLPEPVHTILAGRPQPKDQRLADEKLRQAEERRILGEVRGCLGWLIKCVEKEAERGECAAARLAEKEEKQRLQQLDHSSVARENGTDAPDGKDGARDYRQESPKAITASLFVAPASSGNDASPTPTTPCSVSILLQVLCVEGFHEGVMMALECS